MSTHRYRTDGEIADERNAEFLIKWANDWHEVHGNRRTLYAVAELIREGSYGAAAKKILGDFGPGWEYRIPERTYRYLESKGVFA